MPDPQRIPDHISVLESLSHDHFTPGELANLLGISDRVVVSAVHRGDLTAFVANHRVVDITRADALRWLRSRLEESR